MISEEQYRSALDARDAAQAVINAYGKQEAEAFSRRMQENPIFAEEELIYSAHNLCPCGHGLAYPKNCGAFHYWDCSAILKGIADPNVEHTAKLSFTMYDIKGESDYRGSTRGVFKPKPR